MSRIDASRSDATVFYVLGAPTLSRAAFKGAGRLYPLAPGLLGAAAHTLSGPRRLLFQSSDNVHAWQLTPTGRSK